MERHLVTYKAVSLIEIRSGKIRTNARVFIILDLDPSQPEEGRSIAGVDMLKNYLTIALRHIRRDKGYTAINVSGLAIGMSGCLLIMLFVREELTYDRFHEKSERVARIVRESSALSSAPLGPALMADLPEVESFVRIDGFDVVVRGPSDHAFRERVLAADSTFLEIFDFELLHGDRDRALRRPDEVLLTQTTARKYFGAEIPVGQTLVIDGRPFTVGGLLADAPERSHFQMGILASFEVIAQMSNRLENYRTNWLYTYLLLDPSARAGDVEAKLPAFFERHVGEAWTTYGLQPLEDIHLHSAHLSYDIAPQGDIRQVILFSIIAVLLLVIACINFVNLSTARSFRRMQEVGVRKAMGARRGQLVRQFLGESVVSTCIAVAIACGIVYAALPMFRSTIGKSLELGGSDLAFLAIAMAGLIAFVGILAGGYPAFLLSRYSPVRALRGSTSDSSAGGGLRRALVVFQYAISIFLIVATLTIHEQLEYLRSARLGFEPDQTVVLAMGGDLTGRSEVVRRRIANMPGVRSVSATMSVPGRPVSDYLYRPAGWTGEELPGYDTFFIDDAFVDLLRIGVKQGRDFDPQHASDTSGFLLNEAAVAEIRNQVGEDWASPIGKQIEFYTPSSQGWEVRRSGRVIGVVEDFHYASLHSRIGPLVLQMAPGFFDKLLVRIDADDVPATMKRLEERWTEVAGTSPFEFYFLDASFDALYRSEERMGELAGVFGVLALFVASLGLFGLATYMAERRTKEIGVRKVLGASVSNIIRLLSADFVKLVGIAFVLAAPVAFVALREWLGAFAYRIELSPMLFALGGAAAVVIALFTVSYQAVRAATTDPVKSLRYE